MLYNKSRLYLPGALGAVLTQEKKGDDGGICSVERWALDIIGQVHRLDGLTPMAADRGIIKRHGKKASGLSRPQEIRLSSSRGVAFSPKIWGSFLQSRRVGRLPRTRHRDGARPSGAGRGRRPGMSGQWFPASPEAPSVNTRLGPADTQRWIGL